MLNDLEGLWEVRGKQDIGHRLTFPILYARSKLGLAEREQFNGILKDSATDAAAAKAVQEMIERVGAVEYVWLQMQVFRQRAIQSLKLCANSEMLLDLLDGLVPLFSGSPHASPV